MTRIKRIRMIAAAALSAALLAGPAPLPAQGPQGDMLIVPGQRIGPVRLGMTIAELRSALGDPADSDTLAGARAHAHYYRAQGLTVETRASDNRVTRISVNSPRYRTAEGLSVGARIFAVRAALRPPMREWLYPDASYGIICSPFVNFWYDQAGVVNAIAIESRRWFGCG